MKVAHFAGSDVANFGDQLLSLVFARRMASLADVVQVSPTGRPVPWKDGVTSIGFSAIDSVAGDFNAVVIGGGNLIYTGSANVDEYDDGLLAANLAYPRLWLGAAELAAQQGLPLAWNCTGVRRTFSALGAPLALFAANVSELVAVRDSFSADCIRDAGYSRELMCAVDSGIDAGSLWSPAHLDASYRAVFESRGKAVPHRLTTFHANARYVNEPLASLAARLDRIAEVLQAEPLLLAMGPCHADDALQHELARLMRGSPIVLDGSAQLVEYAACIAHSAIYVGSSLHGLIAACAFERPALSVAIETPGWYKKFSGFLQHVGNPDQLCSSWAVAEARALRASIESPIFWPRRAQAMQTLDAHWTALTAVCNSQLSAARVREKRTEVQRVRKLTERQSVAAAALDDQALDASRLILDNAGLKTALAVPVRRAVDVVVCVHNALDDVRRCLESIVETKNANFRVFVINDCSDFETGAFLNQFVKRRQTWFIEELPERRFYTAAANRGLRRSDADYCVLLNSDTIVPADWLGRLVDCGERSGRIGLIGPMSNAAAWQSLPRVVDDAGDWFVNELPGNLTLDRMSHLVAGLAPRPTLQVPIINGFCMAIKRSVIERIGYLDEQLSPFGYAEEVDYCFRATDAGFDVAIAMDSYVFHAKSKSYGHAKRRELALEGRARIQEQYGADRLERARAAMRLDPDLQELRRRVEAAVSIVEAGDEVSKARPHMRCYS